MTYLVRSSFFEYLKIIIPLLFFIFNKIVKFHYYFLGGFGGPFEYWTVTKAEYIYKGDENDGKKTYSSEDSYELVWIYKGSLKELSSMRRLEYSYITVTSSGDKTEDFTEPPKSLTFTSVGGSKGGAKVSEYEVIQVNVKWDEFEESLELHNKNN